MLACFIRVDNIMLKMHNTNIIYDLKFVVLYSNLKNNIYSNAYTFKF